MSDPRESGAAPRSPNGRFFCVVAEPNGNDHLVEGRSDSTLCGRQITDLWLTSRGLVDQTYGDRHVVCRSCDAVANDRLPEVAPRSSGGAPNEAARALARLLDYAGHKSGGGWCGPVTCQCGYVEARDAAIAAVATLGTDRDNWQTLHAAWTKRANEAEAQVSALRQEADAREKHITIARQEAETLRSQLDTAQKLIRTIDATVGPCETDDDAWKAIYEIDELIEASRMARVAAPREPK